MTSAELKALLPTLHDQEFAGLGQEALLAYVQIYAALYNMVSTNALDEEYGRREIYARKLDGLFDALCHCYATQTQFAKRAEMLYAMFYIVHGTTIGGDPKREERCFELADSLLNDWMSEDGLSSERLSGNARHQPDAAFHSLLKCLAVYLYPCPAEDDPWLLLFQRQIAAWASELDAAGHWPRLSTAEALQRLILLSMNSYLFIDQTHDNAIHLAHAAYCTLASVNRTDKWVDQADVDGAADMWKAATHLSTESLHLCALLYDVAMQGNVYLADKQLADNIATLLDRHRALCPLTSDETLFCLGISADNLCNRISDAVQEEIMEKYS